MRFSAAKVVPLSPYRTAKAFIAWRCGVEAFRTACGARAMLDHVEENRWLALFESGDLPEEAVQREMLNVLD